MVHIAIQPQPNFPVVSTGEFGGNPVQTINARDLHRFLESKQDFSTWIKSRIQ